MGVAAIAAVRFVDRPTWARALPLGVALGLGAATKLSPLPLAAALGGVGLLLWGGGAMSPATVSRHAHRLGKRLAVVPVIALLTFIAVYPYLWRNPFTHLYRMFAFRAQSFEEQASSSPGAAVPSRSDALRRVGHELGDRFSTSGFITAEAEALLGRELWESLDYLDLVLAAAGLLVIPVLAARTGSLLRVAAACTVLGGHVLLVLATMRVEWARYMLPVVLLVALVIGVGVGQVASWWSTLTGRSSSHRRRSPRRRSPIGERGFSIDRDLDGGGSR